MTIEERVALLEMQVVEIEEDVTGLSVDLTELDENVDFLFDETVIQDERLFSLEQETGEIQNDIISRIPFIWTFLFIKAHVITD